MITETCMCTCSCEHTKFLEYPGAYLCFTLNTVNKLIIITNIIYGISYYNARKIKVGVINEYTCTCKSAYAAWAMSQS